MMHEQQSMESMDGIPAVSTSLDAREHSALGKSCLSRHGPTFAPLGCSSVLLPGARGCSGSVFGAGRAKRADDEIIIPAHASLATPQIEQGRVKEVEDQTQS